MATALSLLVLTALALTGGAAFLWRTRGWSMHVGLMLVLAAVMAVNVAIWALPDADGNSLIGRAPE